LQPGGIGEGLADRSLAFVIVLIRLGLFLDHTPPVDSRVRSPLQVRPAFTCGAEHVPHDRQGSHQSACWRPRLNSNNLEEAKARNSTVANAGESPK
jgi:hypothetical protein